MFASVVLRDADADAEGKTTEEKLLARLAELERAAAREWGLAEGEEDEEGAALALEVMVEAKAEATREVDMRAGATLLLLDVVVVGTAAFFVDELIEMVVVGATHSFLVELVVGATHCFVDVVVVGATHFFVELVVVVGATQACF